MFVWRISCPLLALLGLSLSLELRVVVVAGVGSGDVEAVPNKQPLVQFDHISPVPRQSILPVDIGHSKASTCQVGQS